MTNDEYIPKRLKENSDLPYKEENADYTPQYAAEAAEISEELAVSMTEKEAEAFDFDREITAKIRSEKVVQPAGEQVDVLPVKKKGLSDEAFQKRLNVITAAALGVFAAVLAVLLTVLERPERSVIEQRPLAEFPAFSLSSYLDGSYTKDISTWYTDTVPYRDDFKNVNSNIANLFGIRAGDVKFYGVGVIESSEEESSEISVPEESSKEESSAVSEESEPESSMEESVSEPESSAIENSFPEDDPADRPNGLEMEEGLITNGILVIDERGIMLYGGSFNVGKNYANIVNTYKKQLGAGVNVYSMVIPTSVAYYLPEKYASYTASQFANIKNIHEHLAADVYDVDVYSALSHHTDEDIYTRTDHHWASLGAYYASEEFARVAGVPFADLSTYEKVSVPGYVGTLYTYTKDAELLNNPEDFVYYKPAAPFETYYYDTAYNGGSKGAFFIDFTNMKGSLYCTFMGGDAKIVRVKTNVNNGRKLVVLKESYGNALIPFLTGSFDEIYVVDIRYFDLNVIDFIRQHGITDVLFANCAFTATGPNCKHFERIRTYTGAVSDEEEESSSGTGGHGVTLG